MTPEPAVGPRAGMVERDLIVANLSCPREVMRFHLVYNGCLPASGNSAKLQDACRIRDALHRQLEYLWQTHTVLKRLRSTARVSTTSLGSLACPGPESSPFIKGRDASGPLPDGYVDLCEPLHQNGNKHIPLVRKSLDLNCLLDILFLRQEDPGQLVLQGGDLDNRIKTLFDALTAPKPENERMYPQKQQTTYSLLETDAPISSFNVSTGRLLFPETTKPHEVHLVIEVKVSVLNLGTWNLCLLGD